MFLSPSDLSGLSATSGGALQRDQQQTAWERGGSVKQSFTEVLPGNFDAYGASVAQRKAFERAARETDPFKRARALEEAAAYGEEAARLKKPGAQRRPGVPVKRAVHLQQITTAEQAEFQKREMARRGVAIAPPKTIQVMPGETYAQAAQRVEMGKRGVAIAPPRTQIQPQPTPNRKPVYGPGSTGNIAKGGVLQVAPTPVSGVPARTPLPLPGGGFRPSGAGFVPAPSRPVVQQYRTPTPRGGAVYGGGGATGSTFVRMSDLGAALGLGALDLNTYPSLVSEMIEAAQYNVGKDPAYAQNTLNRAAPLLQQLVNENPGRPDVWAPLQQRYNHTQTMILNYKNKPGAVAASTTSWTAATNAAATYRDYPDVAPTPAATVGEKLAQAWEGAKGAVASAADKVVSVISYPSVTAAPVKPSTPTPPSPLKPAPLPTPTTSYGTPASTPRPAAATPATQTQTKSDVPGALTSIFDKLAKAGQSFGESVGTAIGSSPSSFTPPPATPFTGLQLQTLKALTSIAPYVIGGLAVGGLALTGLLLALTSGGAPPTPQVAYTTPPPPAVSPPPPTRANRKRRPRRTS